MGNMRYEMAFKLSFPLAFAFVFTLYYWMMGTSFPVLAMYIPSIL
jgi:hypothetical protein